MHCVIDVEFYLNKNSIGFVFSLKSPWEYLNKHLEGDKTINKIIQVLTNASAVK